MAQLQVASAILRTTNDDGRVVCSVSNVTPGIDAESAAAFANAISTIYNRGECSNRLNVAYDLITA